MAFPCSEGREAHRECLRAYGHVTGGTIPQGDPMDGVKGKFARIDPEGGERLAPRGAQLAPIGAERLLPQNWPQGQTNGRSYPGRVVH